MNALEETIEATLGSDGQTRGAVPGAVWEMEDDELMAALRWRLQQWTPDAAEPIATEIAANERIEFEG